MARAGIRYYSEDDQEVGVTPSQLKRLGKAKQFAYMRFWFNRNFEDPSNETPYNSEEGGFQYVWGGPYNALEQLGDEFGDIVPHERIEQVAERVERGGIIDWAPGRDHPDHQRAQEEFQADQMAQEDQQPPLEDLLATVADRITAGVSPHFGDAWEIGERRRILDGLARLETALRRPELPAGIGHNNPPPDDEEIPDNIRSDIATSSETIREELAKATPGLHAIAGATARLLAAGRWFAGKGEVAADAIAKSFGTTVGAGLGASVLAGIAAGAAFTVPAIREMVLDVCNVTVQWLSLVTSPF